MTKKPKSKAKPKLKIVPQGAGGSPPPPRPPWRPTKYKPEYCQMLVDHMQTMLSFESFAGVIDVDRDTLYEWCKTYKDFSDAKKRAFAKCQLSFERVGNKGMVGGIKGFRDAVFIFSMKNRFGWRDKVEFVDEESYEDLLIGDET